MNKNLQLLSKFLTKQIKNEETIASLNSWLQNIEKDDKDYNAIIDFFKKKI